MRHAAKTARRHLMQPWVCSVANALLFALLLLAAVLVVGVLG